jgi:hypothetical protein
MKRYIKRIGLTVFFIICITIIWLYFKPAPDYIREPVLENEEDYTRIAELYYDDYLSNYQRLNQDVMAYTIADNSTIGSLADAYSPEKGYCDPKDIRWISLDEEETTSANVVIGTYKMMDNKGWEYAFVYDSFVTFCTVNGVESLVYSANGKRPSYVNTPDDDSKHIIVNRISKHWFHCKKR